GLSAFDARRRFCAGKQSNADRISASALVQYLFTHRARDSGIAVTEGVDLGNLGGWHRGQRPQLQHQRCDANTASGSRAQTFPAQIQAKRLISAPSKNEIAANGTKFTRRKISASGPLSISPLRMSQPERDWCRARSALPC